MPDARGRGGAATGAILALLALAAAPAGGAPHPPPAPLADTVVLVSVDGMRWDYPARAGASTLERMARQGASAGGLVPCFPSSTFPAHATLATGVFPDRHGILNNEFLDRERGDYRRDDDPSWLLAEPLWVTAERQGVRTAVFHWVLSYGPWRGVAASRGVPFSSETGDAEKVARIVAWLGERGSERPRLILSYLHGVDGIGHREGPDSPEVLRAVRRTDRLLGRLLRAVQERGGGAALIVVSDHGMAAVSRSLRPDRLLRGRARGARLLSTGATANLYCPDTGSCAAAGAALARVPGLTLYSQEDLPPALRYRLPSRTGDWVAIAPGGSYFGAGEGGAREPPRGMHGYRPEEPAMRGIFYAWGSGLRAGARRDLLAAVDVAPLVCRLLGILPPPGIDGHAPADLIAEVTPSPVPPRPPSGRGSGRP
ncbi:MAG: hypothetical protein DMF50_03000 [Acidobacteria bacterium]|nr:MAG: hypothetical protein DMF50_03000 [Acidobacteriota bacterium]